jgi:bifunctional non-homologous end joining protein LigD
MGERPGADPLGRYRSKRRASSTPEPFGAVAAPGGAGLFVVQKHAARRLHYDFRLEHGGVLLSWAVPKGPSYDPTEKRMAVRVEDHPVEYAGFEGVIPPGNYGAGSVLVWDTGTWRPLADVDEGLESGKLLFELAGQKLRGEWTLVRLKKSPKDWLLIKHRDAYAGAPAPGELSVLSGRSLEDLAAAPDKATAVVAELVKRGAPRRDVDPAEAGPMLAQSRDAPFSGAGWLFELKYDGFRLRASRRAGEVQLLYRSGRDATVLYPEVVKAIAALPHDPVLLDGEVVVLDGEGRPSFQGLQGRALLSRASDVARASLERPATFFAFDLLALDGFDLRPLPLSERKALLARVVPRAGAVRLADHIEERGEDLFREARARGLEGVVGKRADSPYRSGRSAAWQKVRAERAGDFAVVGFTSPAAGRSGFGALHLAAAGAEGLTYAGSVGSGFGEADLTSLHARLSRSVRATPACAGPVPRGRGNTWVTPELVCEVRYLERTEEGLLRAPVFLRVRDDKTLGGIDSAIDREEPGPAPVQQETRAPRLTNLEKVFWPGEGLTKGDLVSYYREIAPWMLHYLRDRPLTLTRYPDGIEGKSFFQKDAPEWTPSWVRTERMWSEDTKRELAVFVCDDLEMLLHVVNLGTIPLHVTASRVGALGRPDWTVIDLDPKEAPFAHVVRIARRLHALCDELGLPSFPKTTGQAGLHVLVPLGGACTHDQARDLALVLARRVAEELPEIATLARSIPARGGRVYLDCFQNGQGKTIVAPFSVRPRPGAPVSMPLRWSEVNQRLDPRRFTIRSVPARMERLGQDPLRPVLSLRPDLLAAVERLRAGTAKEETW